MATTNLDLPMREAEHAVRQALTQPSPAQQCAALTDLYFSSRDSKRDAIVATIIAHLTLRRPERGA